MFVPGALLQIKHSVFLVEFDKPGMTCKYEKCKWKSCSLDESKLEPLERPVR